MSADWPWSEFDLEGPSEAREIKRAYATKLKTIDRSNPEIFQALQGARDAALKGALDNDGPRKSRPKIRNLRDQQSEGTVAGSDADEIAPPIVPVAPVSSKYNPKVPSEDPTDYESVDIDYDARENQQSPEETKHVKLDVDKETTDDVKIRKQEFTEPFSDLGEKGPKPSASPLTEKLENLFERREYASIPLLFKQSHYQESRDLQLTVERMLALEAKTFLEKKKKIPKALATVIDQEFAWSIDAIATSRRLKSIESIELVIASLKKPPPAERDPDEEPLTAKSIFFLVCFVALVGHSIYQGFWTTTDPERSRILYTLITFFATILYIIALAVPLFIVWWLSFPLRKHGLNRLAKRAFNRLPEGLREWITAQQFEVNELLLIIAIVVFLVQTVLLPAGASFH